jgi:hypothetical protein
LRELRFEREYHTTLPGSAQPSIAPVFAQCIVSRSPPSVRTSAKKRLYRRTSVPRSSGGSKITG